MLVKPNPHQRGLSMVELMVGIAVGLFVVGGAGKLFVDYLTDSRMLLLETRVNQDLRAAADLVARDLRRSGYWQRALAGATFPPAANPYQASLPAPGATASEVTYTFSRDDPGASEAEHNSVQLAENFGFKLDGSRIRSRLGNLWQELTDPNTVRVTRFDITAAHQELSLGQYCTPVCALGSPGCPSVLVRRFDITIAGTAPPPNAHVQRQVSVSVRPRNDEVPIASCP